MCFLFCSKLFLQLLNARDVFVRKKLRLLFVKLPECIQGRLKPRGYRRTVSAVFNDELAQTINELDAVFRFFSHADRCHRPLVIVFYLIR